MNSASYYLNLLSGGAGSALENSESGTDVSTGRVANSLEALDQHMHAAAMQGFDKDRSAKLLAAADSGMRKLSAEGQQASLTEEEVFGIEAVILTDGSRPSLIVQDNEIQLQRSVLRDWHADAQMHEHRISAVLHSIGRIDDPAASQQFQGTGFVIDSGVVVTNRHVLEEIADEQPGDDGKSTWKIHPDIEINFGHEFERPSGSGYAVKRVLFAGPKAINREVHFDRLDLAVLECATDNDFPPAIQLAEPSSSINSDSRVYVVGYPAKPRYEDVNVLTDIFNDTFGHKRWAPGKIKAGAGDLDGDMKEWVTSHDASTLGGNSGSAVFLFEGSGDVCVGLHFAGLSRKQNYAHVIAKIRRQLANR